MTSHLVNLIGLIGGFCFAYCGVPVAYMTWKASKSIGTPISIAWMITLGAIFMYSYLFLTYGFNTILTINYSVEALSWALIVYYHYFGKKN